MATDRPRRMITFDVPEGQFGARVVGVCIRDDHVLLQSVEGADWWLLPGGRCEIGETSHESLCREMREEIDVDVRIERLLWIVESFFHDEARLFHELGLYYRMELPESLPPHLTFSSTHRTIDGGAEVFFRWFSLGALPRIVPAFLQEALLDLPETPQCIVDRGQG